MAAAPKIYVAKQVVRGPMANRGGGGGRGLRGGLLTIAMKVVIKAEDIGEALRATTMVGAMVLENLKQVDLTDQQTTMGSKEPLVPRR
jgi:hypothetical protein